MPAVTFTNLGATANPDIDDNTDASSYSNASWTPPTSGMIVAIVVNVRTLSPPNVPTISGNSLTWVQVANQSFDNNSQFTIFAANASGSTTGVTTIDFAGQVQRQCGVSFFQVNNSDVAGGVAQTFVQNVFNSGVGATEATVTLSAAGNSNNRPIFATWRSGTANTTPRANWTELDDLGGGGDSFVGPETQFRSDAFETTGSATWAVAETWRAYGAEIKAAVDFAGARSLKGVGI